MATATINVESIAAEYGVKAMYTENVMAAGCDYYLLSIEQGNNFVSLIVNPQANGDLFIEPTATVAVNGVVLSTSISPVGYEAEAVLRTVCEQLAKIAKAVLCV